MGRALIMPFVWNKNVPLATQRINATQLPILNNWDALESIVGVNHVTFTGLVADFGKHNLVEMPQQPGAPAAFAANEMGLFTKNEALTSQSEMYVRRAPSSDIPFTAASKVGTTVNVDGWTYLPSGLLMRWGYRVISPGSAFTITYNPASPAFTTAVLNVQLTCRNNTNNNTPSVAYLKNFTSSLLQCTGYLSTGFPAGADVFYVAIGY